MARFAILYTESYARTYFVEAADYDHAKDKLQQAMWDGNVDGPDECSDSSYMDVTTRFQRQDLNDDRNLDVE